jgi:hypothetical protein
MVIKFIRGEHGKHWIESIQGSCFVSIGYHSEIEFEKAKRRLIRALKLVKDKNCNEYKSKQNYARDY